MLPGGALFEGTSVQGMVMSVGKELQVASLTLVIPVYRERVRLADTLRKVSDFMAHEAPLKVDAIFVNDGSPDDSAAFIAEWIETHQAHNMRLISYARNEGKGFAVKSGVLAATGDVILMSDTDLSTPLNDWHKLRQALANGADIACGSRAVRGSRIGKPPPLHRRVLSRVFNLLVRLAGVHHFKDTQCGFKLFRAGAANEIFNLLRTRRFAFDVEMIALARDLGYRVDEVPVRWDYSDHSTVKVFSSGSRMLFDIARLAAKRVFLGRAKR